MSTSQQTDPLIGRLVDGRYRVRARIARGGMATVYVATDLRLERRIALKVMHSHLSDDSVFQSRFIQEARAAARLADPHVVNVFDQGQDGEMAYLVMEYLPGITLRELLREQRRLTVPQAVSVMDAVLAGLAAAHRAGIVHRDVKPENVLLAEDGRIKIGDFGLARATTANTASGAQLLGTIAYLAPELVTRGTADARSDIYSLGIMLYEMLVGEQPYKGEQPMQIAYQHATDSVPRPSVKNPGVPEQLDELVLWATERSPDDRPSDAGEMLDRLREIERELGVTPVVPRTMATTVIREESGSSGDLTRVLPAATGTVTTAPVADDDNAARLRRATRRRSAKGAWLIALVVLLAALAGGAGWWFGSGPGSMVAVADVSGMSFADAQARLGQDGLVAVEKSEPSLDVAAGAVTRTEPGSGARVDQGASVDVYVSTGPAEVSVQALAGLSESQAREYLDAQTLIVVEPVEEFSGEIPSGSVIWASVAPAAGGDAFDCAEGCTARQGDTVTLWVSVGSVPDVVDRSVDGATGDLAAVGLTVAGQIDEYSDEIDEGRVIRIADKEGGGPWRPGDAVTLVVSQGPQLFTVPDLTGMTLAQARQAASAAGFAFDYDERWDAFPDVFTEVESQNPSPGEMEESGTEISVRIRAAA